MLRTRQFTFKATVWRVFLILDHAIGEYETPFQHLENAAYEHDSGPSQPGAGPEAKYKGKWRPEALFMHFLQHL
jgi:hypothetical protein